LDSSRLDVKALQDVNFDEPLPEELTFGNLDEPHANPQWHDNAFSSFVRADMLSNIRLIVSKTDLKRDIEVRRREFKKLI
jgi:hypothetical protein